jgi:hypothetical protein
MMPLTDVELIPVIDVNNLRPILMTSTPSIPVPVTVTTVPTGPEDDEIPVIVGPIEGLMLHPVVGVTAISVGMVETGAGGCGT